jgi:hypothetical protein|tara:strand:- start:4732 stop:4974 length:243 start_codon:yes stop_codon:yes gene_type:complete
MRSFTLIQKRAYLKEVISDDEKAEELKKLEASRSAKFIASGIERFSSWNEKQIDAAINAHIRSTVARLTDPAVLEHAVES